MQPNIHQAHFSPNLPLAHPTPEFFMRFRFLLLTCLLCVMLGTSAHAATFTVTSTADTDGSTCGTTCTLRQAINAANGAAGDDTITFASNVRGTINLSTVGEMTNTDPPLGNSALVISGNVSIVGPGAGALTVRRSATSAYRLFRVPSGTAVNISGLTFSNGGSSGSEGGAIFTSGTMTIANCVFDSNQVINLSGAAISNMGNLTVSNSSFTNNHSVNMSSNNRSNAGAIFTGGPLLVTGCTMSGNTVDGFGGAIVSQYEGPITIYNSTLSGNSAAGASAVFNGVGTANIENCTIYSNTTPASSTNGSAVLTNSRYSLVKVKNSIISGNTCGRNTANVATISSYSSSLYHSDGYNVIGSDKDDSSTDASSAFNAVGDQKSVDNPGLSALANNGGPTLTHALLSSSPALDKGIATGADQRGRARPLDMSNVDNAAEGNGSDIGAVEQDAITLAQSGPEFVVTKLANTIDSVCSPTDCSLRDAINAANAGGDANTITFAPSVFGSSKRTIATDGTALPTITSDITITGPTTAGAGVTIDAGGKSQITAVDSGASLTLTSLTLSNGYDEGYGGAINNTGTLTIDSSTFFGNNTSYGGAIYSTGTLAIRNSTFTDNQGSYGGVIYSVGTLTIDSSTISANNSINDGALLLGKGVTTLTNSIVAGNTQYYSGSPDIHGNVSSDSDYNVVGDTTQTNVTGKHNINADPKLGPFADNGGPTQTFALLTGSPAINAGLTALTTDQRGATRPSGNADDIGAFEVQNSAPVITTTTLPSTRQGQTYSQQLAATDAEGDPLTWSLLSGNLPAGLSLSSGGLVSGTPTTIESQTFTVQVSDGKANTDTQVLTLAVLEAQLLVVNTSSDTSTDTDGLTSLREAIGFANSNGNPSNAITFDAAVFGSSKQTITLNGTALPASTSTISITGPTTAGAGVTIDAGGKSRITTVNSGASLTLAFLSLTGGNNSDTGGGAIYNQGTLSINNCTFMGNSVADFGGAIVNVRGTLTVSNSTFAGNSSDSRGGAIYNFGTLTIDSSTFSGNSASIGGALYLSGGTATLTNSIVAGNTGSTSGSNIYANVSSASDYNVVDNTANTNVTGKHNINAPAKLGALADNGGPTQTFALLAGSPAIDAGSTALTVDQRGLKRPIGNSPDIGAFEVQNSSPVISTTTLPSARQGQSYSQQLVATDTDGDTLTWSLLSGNLPAGLSLSSGGLISGTPTTIQDASFTVQVSDGKGGTDTQELTLAVLEAQSLVVNTTSDTSTTTDGLTSLREAIDFANSHGNTSNAISFDATVFGASKQTITLNDVQLPTISNGKSISITGPTTAGAGVTISGNNASGIFYLDYSSTNVALALSNLTLIQGSASSGGAINNSSAPGNTISISISNSTFSGNTTSQFGGAIFNNNGALTISNSTFSGNSARLGGAIFNASSTGPLTIESSTISGNSARQGGGLNLSVTATINNSIVAGNTATGGTAGDNGPDIYGSVDGGDYNLIGDTTSTRFPDSSTHNITGHPAQLGTLADNGGPTQTFALQGTSPAINAGSTTLTTDQRGVTRPSGSADDIGAFEFVEVAPTVVSVSPQGASDKVGAKRTFTLTMSDANGATDIREMWLLVNDVLDWSSGATLIYRPSTTSPTSGQLFLRRGDDFLPPIKVGTGASSSDVLDNGAVRVVASDVTVSVSGNSITLNLPVTIRDGLVGQDTLFARAQDTAGATDPSALAGEFGFVRKGTYTVTPQFAGATNSAPTLSNLNPSATNTTLSGSGLAPTAQNFGFFVQDANGIGDIQEVWFLAGKQRDWSSSATFVYYPRTRRLVLRSDDGQSFLGGGQIGSAGIIENSQVRVDLSKVKLLIYPDGKSLGLSLPLQAKTGLVGQNGVWLRVQDTHGATSPDGDDLGFVLKGNWNVKAATADTKPSNGNS